MPLRDFFGIVFEAAQRADLAFEYHHVVAQQADIGVALDKAVGDPAAGDRSQLSGCGKFPARRPGPGRFL